MDIDTKILIKKIWLAPKSSGWFKELMSDILEKHSLSANLIKKSDILSPPIYLDTP